MTDEITLDAPETRIERFLAAAAGVEGITLDEPVTRIEKYLYKIAQGSGGVPAVEDADKGKFLHANESTGDLEWATAGGSGGGVLVVNVSFTFDDAEETWSFTADKTFAEIVAADGAGQKILAYCTEVTNGSVGTPSWLYVSNVDDDTFVAGTTDIPKGVVGLYSELSFYMDADESTVDVYTWMKKQE